MSPCKAMSDIRHTQSWDEMPLALKNELLRKMPLEVQQRVLLEDKLSAEDLKRYAEKYLDFSKFVVLWHVKDGEPETRKALRQMSRDLFEGRRRDRDAISKKYNCDANKYSQAVIDVVVMAENIKPKCGHHWEIEYVDKSVFNDADT